MRSMRSLMVAFFMVSAPIASMAAQSVEAFVGLWEGVDPNDGGHQILSIADNGDGTVKLLLHDTTFTLCPTDEGVSEGTGIVQSNDDLKSADFTLTCLATQMPQAIPTTFHLENGVLHRIRATPLRPVDYYRTSER
ncbi:MAG TPA: hypothetical protein VKB53_04235 [Gammaproteobacteria bacterium]|jgi:hypothetical protein|nr:hypothetical protein [Gammaproteobacteria bacterium]